MNIVSNRVFRKQMNKLIAAVKNQTIDDPKYCPEDKAVLNRETFIDKTDKLAAALKEGGGLPAVEGSGKALVSVNGEWVEQDGYGYTEKGNQIVITWDGDTEGRVKHPAVGLYFVSDKYIDADSLTGAKATFSNGEEYIFERADCDISEEDGVVILMATSSVDIPVEGNVFTNGPFIMSISEEYGGILPKGTYFSWRDTIDTGSLTEPFYTKSLTYSTPDTVHKIDEKYLPSSLSGGIVAFGPDFVDDGDGDDVKIMLYRGTTVVATIYVHSGTATLGSGMNAPRCLGMSFSGVTKIYVELNMGCDVLGTDETGNDFQEEVSADWEPDGQGYAKNVSGSMFISTI